MHQSPLSPSTHVPRFRLIANSLKQEIANGNLAVHSALPSERVMAELHDVSRMTARRALEAMEAEGLAYSGGRKGRFVSPPRLKYDISNMVSFTANAQDEDIDLTIKVISSQVVEADPTLAPMLVVRDGELLYKYTRLFLIKDHPVFIEEEYAIVSLFPDFLDHDLRQSTTLLLEKHYNTFAHTGNITIRMRTLQPEEAGLLNLSASHAAIELEQIISNQDGKPFCFGRQLWRGELAEFSARAVIRETTK